MHALLLLCAVFAAYSPLWYHEQNWEFIESWDDKSNFLENDIYKSLDVQNLWRMLTEIHINVYEPVAWVFKAIVFHFFGKCSGIATLGAMVTIILR